MFRRLRSSEFLITLGFLAVLFGVPATQVVLELQRGQHVQFNVVNTATLREAQARPEQYRDLVVRVAGFSVLFTAIDPVLQEDIIARTEHAL